MKHKNEVEIRVYGIIEKISQTICLQIAGKFPDSMVNILPHNPLQETLIELQVTFKASEAIPYHQFALVTALVPTEYGYYDCSHSQNQLLQQ